MRESLESVTKKRKGTKALTFCIPWDLADDPSDSRGKQARKRFEEAKARWSKIAPGVTVDLLSGGQLLERLAREEHRGREWFFFSERVLGLDWCSKELAHTIDDAGDRYTPQQNIDLPVDRILEAIALPSDLGAHLENLRSTVLKAGRTLFESSKEAWDAPLANIRAHLVQLESQRLTGQHPPDLQSKSPRRIVEDASSTLGQFMDELRPIAWPEKSRQTESTDTAKEKRESEIAQALSVKARALDNALMRLRSFLDSPNCQTAERRALFVEGPAGRGKTHLFCDVAKRLLASGHPVIAVLGQRFRDQSPWQTLALLLGEPNLSPSEIATIFAASGEASGQRAVLLIDALNESADASMWAAELSDLRRRLTETGWVGFAVSCRSTYLDLVEPSGGPDACFARIQHYGYQGREFDAIDQIFRLHGLQPPKVPLLLPEFSNPLFLKLYCEGMKENPNSAHGADHLSAVFEHFVNKRSARVEKRLQLDRRLKIVPQAIADFANSLGEAGSDRLEYARAHKLISSHASHLHKSPDTLLEAMVSEGLLAIDRGWIEDSDEPAEMVSFPYQRFSDHLIARSFLTARLGPASRTDVEGAFRDKDRLRDWLLEAPGGLIEALAVQLPERWEIELPDLFPVTDDDRHSQYRWSRAFEAFLSSIVLRDRDAFNTRTTELINDGLNYFAEETIQSLLAVAADPDHPHNAFRLHDFLRRTPMPDRDAYWTDLINDSFGYADNALDRLIRWSARGPYAWCSDDVIELACTALAWTFTSPNRFARDYATKALATLAIGRPNVHLQLVARFSNVDDPYITQRLTAAIAGSVIRDPGESYDRKTASRLIDFLISNLIESPNASPDLLTRDYIASLARWMRRQKLIPPRLLARATPPYGSKAPKVPRRASYLEATYPRTEDKTEGYGLLHFSALSSHSDWSRYVVSGVVDDFLPTKLGEPLPPEDPSPSQPSYQVNSRAWKRFEKSLDSKQVELLASDDPTRVAQPTDELTENQRILLARSFTPRTRRPRAYQRPMAYPPERASRFIFQRAVEMGWTPERFGELDWSIARRSSYRTSSKRERFGKKYQWIALGELLARLADNFTLSDWADVVPYVGAWQLRARNLDPTLPPERIEIGDELEPIRQPTFPVDSSPAWWSPTPPTFDPPKPGLEGAWAELKADLPIPIKLLRVTDGHDVSWVILDGHHDWHEDPKDVASLASATGIRRDLAILSSGTFIRQKDASNIRSWLSDNPDLVRSLPDWGTQGIYGVFWGELPWESPSHGFDGGWRRSHGDGHLPVQSAPVRLSYQAEGSGYDCSITDRIGVDLPSKFLADKAGLRWNEKLNGWIDDSGHVAVQYRETDEGFHRDRALLMREDRLADFLQGNNLCLVVGLFCERRVFDEGRFSRPIPLGWVDYAGHMIFDGKQWESVDLKPIDRRGEIFEKDQVAPS